jgi:hypothetical protein
VIALDDDYLVLYVFGRTDLASMNPGKMAAQAVHAGHHFSKVIKEIRAAPQNSNDTRLLALYDEWENTTPYGYGTTITLETNEARMKEAVELVQRYGFFARITPDPTYPVKDGEVCHLIPVNTSGFVFGMKSALEPFLSEFSLYR